VEIAIVEWDWLAPGLGIIAKARPAELLLLDTAESLSREDLLPEVGPSSSQVGFEGGRGRGFLYPVAIFRRFDFWVVTGFLLLGHSLRAGDAERP